MGYPIQNMVWKSGNELKALPNEYKRSRTEYCQLRERTQNLWSEITLFLLSIGYRNFRLEHRILIFGDTEMDSLFNLIITMAKMVMYQNRGKRNIYSMRHFETLLGIERESEEIYAINQDILELHERKWDIPYYPVYNMHPVDNTRPQVPFQYVKYNFTSNDIFLIKKE